MIQSPHFPSPITATSPQQDTLTNHTATFDWTPRSSTQDHEANFASALKNKKLGLEDSIKRAKETKEGLKVPQEVLCTDLKNHRTRVMSQIKQHGSGMQELEQQIFAAGCQLRLVMEENQRFEEACTKLRRELSDLDNQRQENEKIKLASQNELIRQKSELSRKWDADNMMQEFFASRDQATAEAFGRLLDKTGKRENKIDEITDKLRDELGMLSDFLDNIASRRPEGAKIVHFALTVKTATLLDFIFGFVQQARHTHVHLEADLDALDTPLITF
ncbi:laminin subunit alpha-2 [Elysia marginata]|uniref:Laminin subunit alpha-2 n=1 Tax=Elysia marginata TaxID=1093978 RepID=A0AAV4JFB7_9GAST|nr:laminin subunit alpha-2 [Elysia marginata]